MTVISFVGRSNGGRGMNHTTGGSEVRSSCSSRAGPTRVWVGVERVGLGLELLCKQRWQLQVDTSSFSYMSVGTPTPFSPLDPKKLTR